MYCVLSFRVTCLFAFRFPGVYDVGGCLKGTNHDKRRDDTSMNICKGPPLLEESRTIDSISSEESDNNDSKCNIKIVTETNESND